MADSDLSSEERKILRRERKLRRRKEDKNHEPRRYSEADERFASRLAAGFSMMGATQ
jgi:hypothetical protein